MEKSIPSPPPATETQTLPQQLPQEVTLVNIPVTDENTALNILVGFIGVAQKRGAFNIQESAKLWECIQRFNQQQA